MLKMQKLISSSASEGGGWNCEEVGSISSPSVGSSRRVKQGRRLCALGLGGSCSLIPEHRVWRVFLEVSVGEALIIAPKAPRTSQ